MKKEDFTEEELTLLLIMFNNMEDFIRTLNYSKTDWYIDENVLFHLTEKLHIEDIVM